MNNFRNIAGPVQYIGLLKFRKNNYKNMTLKKMYYVRHAPIQGEKFKVSCVVDLRSDTVTKPSDGMRRAIKDALVGDDVKQEDKTILELERRMAEITNKEAGLFVASGTMGNLVSVLSHCSHRGSEVLLGDMSHIFNYEQGNIAQFGGVQPFIVPTNPNGTLCLHRLKSCIRVKELHCCKTELICFENTHGHLGGKVVPLDWIDEVACFAKENYLALHVDGARLFNASIASGKPVSRLLQGVHSASICFSKGLGAPVGSVVVGNEAFICRARRIRKALGGGWRQAGVLAAAAIYALDNNVQRLKEDHDNARLIGEGVNDLKDENFWVNLDQLETNMVLLNFNAKLINGEELCNLLMEVSEGEQEALGETISVLSAPHTASSIRLVTHLDVSRTDASLALAKIKFVIEKLRLVQFLDLMKD